MEFNYLLEYVTPRNMGIFVGSAIFVFIFIDLFRPNVPKVKPPTVRNPEPAKEPIRHYHGPGPSHSKVSKSKPNPHRVTKTQVGLGNVPSYATREAVKEEYYKAQRRLNNKN